MPVNSRKSGSDVDAAAWWVREARADSVIAAAEATEREHARVAAVAMSVEEQQRRVSLLDRDVRDDKDERKRRSNFAKRVRSLVGAVNVCYSVVV